VTRQRSCARSNDSIIWRPPWGRIKGDSQPQFEFVEALVFSVRLLAEIRRRAVAHIAAKSEVSEKMGNVAPAKPRAQTRIQPQRVMEVATGKKGCSIRLTGTSSRATSTVS